MEMGKKGSGCFPCGTQILTPYGLKDISTLSTGDIVYAVSSSSGEFVLRAIMKVNSYANRKILQVSLNDGTQIRATATHSFQTGKKWKRADQLNVGDQVCHYDEAKGSIMKSVTAVQFASESEDVFNIIVDGDFNFIADGALAHSFTYMKGIRMSAWRVYSFIQSLKGNTSSIPAI